MSVVALNDLLTMKDAADFVRLSYMTVLLRAPSEEELQACLQTLGRGMSREHFLVNLRGSEEGIIRNVRVSGLRPDRVTLRWFRFCGNRIFLERAYLVLLGRSTLGTETERFLSRLASGEIDRTSALYEIRYSEEGRAWNIPVRGLKRRYSIAKQLRRLERLPLVGGFFRLFTAGAYLQQLRDNQYEQERRLVRMQERIDELQNASRELNLKGKSDAVKNICALLDGEGDE